MDATITREHIADRSDMRLQRSASPASLASLFEVATVLSVNHYGQH